MSFSLRNAFIAFFMAFFVMGVTAPAADAARLGGGSKLGKSYTVPKKSPTSQQAAPNNSNTAAATAAGGKKGMMGGLLGGLLAGGLLSALFFGGAFDGIQIMDVLIIAVIAFVLFKLFSSGKKAAAAQANQSYAAQGAGGMGSPQTFQTDNLHSGSQQESSVVESSVVTTPPWFNKDAFLKGAQEHFLRLQKAWDAQDWSEIATYTSPELLDELKAERSKHPDDQVTEVTSVMADLVKFEDYQDHVVVSVHFYGWIKENGEANPSEFGEYWHLNRDMTKPAADWFIVGLEPENR